MVISQLRFWMRYFLAFELQYCLFRFYLKKKRKSFISHKCVYQYFTILNTNYFSICCATQYSCNIILIQVLVLCRHIYWYPSCLFVVSFTRFFDCTLELFWQCDIFFYCTLELFWQCGIFFDCTLELFWRCGIFFDCTLELFWQCGIFFYSTLELFWQCGIFFYSTVELFWQCGIFFDCTLELFWQCGIFFYCTLELF